jgi:uncharacterized membrane protein
MPESANGVNERLDDLARRLDRVERAVGLPEATPRPRADAGPPYGPATGSPPDALPEPRPAAPASPPAPRTAPPGPRPARPARSFDLRRLEWLVGARGFAIGGAIIVVLAIGFFVQMSWQRGWISPPMRCGLVALLGVGLLGAGEVVRRRLGSLAAVGPLAAGLGSIYFAAFAAHEWYALVSQPVGLVLLVLTTLVGVGFSAVARSASIGALALVGGFLAPVLLATSAPSHVFFPSYLLSLLAVGLALGVWFDRRLGLRRFAVVRALGWWGTVLLGTWWAAHVADGASANALVFIAGAWALVHAELVFSAWRWGGSLAVHARRGGGSLALSFSTTAWAAFASALLFEHVSPGRAWIGPASYAALAAIAGAAALRVGPDPQALRRLPDAAPGRLAAALAAQTGALVIVAVAMALDGPARAVAWLALGLAAFECGDRLRSPGVLVYGLVALTLATAQVMALDLIGAWSDPPTLIVGGLAVSGAWWLLAMAGAAWLHVAWRAARRGALGSAPIATAAGLASLALVVAHEQTAGGALALWWVALGLAAHASRRVDRRMGLGALGACLAAAAAAPWALSHATERWAVESAPALLHPGLWSALAISAAGVWVGRAAAGEHAPRAPGWSAGVLALVAGAGVFLAGTSLEASRVATLVFSGDETARDAVLSVWWGVVGIAAIAAGFARRVPAVRYAGLALMAAGAGKAVVYDLAEVSQGWRIVSLLGVGALMLVVAVAYARLAAAFAGERAASGEPSEDHPPSGVQNSSRFPSGS